MLVEDILARKGTQVIAVTPACTVREMAKITATRNIGTTIVADADGAMLGIISERDLVRALGQLEGDCSELPVSELMTRSVITCTPETTINEALSLMGLHRIRHLPVIEADKVAGLISIRDLLEFRLEGLEENFAALMRAKRESSRAQQVTRLADKAKHDLLLRLNGRLEPQVEELIELAEQLDDEGNELLPEQRAQLRKIGATGRDLLALTNDLMRLTRLQAEELKPRKIPVEMTEVMTSCVHELKEVADEKGVSIRVDAQRGSKLSVDKRMFKQMVHQLLSNAVQFTPPGGTVSLSSSANEDGAFRVSVTDTGIGIPREELARVVEPFYQVQSSTARRYAGTGLGLALVDAMAHAHGGALSLESRVGVGTTATLYLPASGTISAHEPPKAA